MTLAQIRRLFPQLEMHLHTATVLPPLARRLGRLTQSLYPVLAAIPPLRTHYLGLLMKGNDENKKKLPCREVYSS